jgi:hypothetical protein
LEFYWFNVLKNNSSFSKIIKEADENVLKFLTKIALEIEKDKTDENIEVEKYHFHFKSNPFFTNEILTLSFKIDKKEDFALFD